MTHVDVGSFASKTNLASLETEVDKIDADKLKAVPADLAKLTNVVKNDVVKKTEYNSLKTKVDSIGTTKFGLKTKYEKDGSDFEDKISKMIVTWLKKQILMLKLLIEGKIPSISGLATNSALTAVENKIPAVSSLVEKTDYNAKVSETENKVNDHNHDQYITTPEFNTMAADVFKARLAA